MANPTVNRFKGLNNVSDPLRLKLGWMSAADNVDITNTGAIERRKGYVKVVNGAFTGAFTTSDLTRMYAVVGQSLVRFNADLTTEVVTSLVGTGRMHWAEVNRLVFFNNGVDSGIISASHELSQWSWPEPPSPALTTVSGSLPSGVYLACFTYLLPDGRETGAGVTSAIYLDGTQAMSVTNVPSVSGLITQLYIAPANSTVMQMAGSVVGSTTWNSSADNLGIDLATQFMDPLPRGSDVIQHWHGKMFAAQYLQASNQTVVWISEPLGFHLFNLNSGFFLVSGRVLALAPTAKALVVATDAEIYAYNDEGMVLLAPYGVVPGWSWAKDEDNDTVMLWTKRGVCRALPFENITQEYVSVAPGKQAGCALVRRDGEKKFVSALVAGGTAFNPRS